MRYLIYFLTAIGATAVGSLTGMGGGIIIKPVMDMLGEFDAQTIGVLSSMTVFSMSAVSIGKQMLARTQIPFDTAVPLAAGSIAGGLAGERLLRLSVEALKSNQLVTAVQNTALSLLILSVILYMRNQQKIRSLQLRGLRFSILAGLFLGLCSSFLGIGGGPVNVALMIFLFSFDIKTSALCSLITIFFAQLSKLGAIALSTGFAAYDLRAAPVMIAGAVAGGFIGAGLNRRCREETVERAFRIVQVFVLSAAVFNVVKSLTG